MVLRWLIIGGCIMSIAIAGGVIHRSVCQDDGEAGFLITLATLMGSRLRYNTAIRAVKTESTPSGQLETRYMATLLPMMGLMPISFAIQVKTQS